MNGRIQVLKDKMLSQPRYVSIEQALIITQTYKDHEQDSVQMKRAYSLYNALNQLEISIEPEELIVGNRTKGVRYGVVFPEGCMAPAGVKLIPTQLFSAGADFLMFIILFIILNSKVYKRGIPVGIYLAGYAIGRSIIECFRSDARGAVLGLSTSQFISIFAGIAGLVFLGYRLRVEDKALIEENTVEDKEKEQE